MWLLWIARALHYFPRNLKPPKHADKQEYYDVGRLNQACLSCAKGQEALHAISLLLLWKANGHFQILNNIVFIYFIRMCFTISHMGEVEGCVRPNLSLTSSQPETLLLLS